MRVNRSIALAALLAITAGLGPRLAGSQTNGRRIVVTPWAGAFVPATRIGELAIDDGSVTTTMGLKQRMAPAVGLNASYWFNSLAGIEVGGAFAFSDAEGSAGLTSEIPSFTLTGAHSAYVAFGSAKLMVNLLRFTERSALRLGVGPALITRGGNAFKHDGATVFDGLTDLGGVVSLCSRIPITDFMSARLRAENYMYSAKVRFDHPSGASEYTFGSKLQNDMIFSAGLQMVFWR